MDSESSHRYTFGLDRQSAITKTIYEKGKEVIIIEDTPSRSPSHRHRSPRPSPHSTHMSPSHIHYHYHRSKRPKYTSHAESDEHNSFRSAKHRSEHTPYMCRMLRYAAQSTASTKSSTLLTDPSGVLPIVVVDDPPATARRMAPAGCRDDRGSTLKRIRRERSNLARRRDNAADGDRRYHNRSSIRGGRYYHPYESREPRGGRMEISRSYRHNYDHYSRQDDFNDRFYGQRYFEAGPSNNKQREYRQNGREERRRISVTDTSTRTKYASPGELQRTSSRVNHRRERLEWDDEDGHLVVAPGMDIGSRYRIFRILGQGTFGRVVQAWDKKGNVNVAIKIIRAIQKYLEASYAEIGVLNTIKENDPYNDFQCIHIKEFFEYRGHMCIVFPMYAQSVYDFLKSNSYQSFPMKHVQQLSRQLLRSVAFIHSIKLCHTDLKPENVLLADDDCIIVPSKHSSQRAETKELLSTYIKLIDFGSAIFEDEYHSPVISTRHYRAPEVILGLGWSYPCDVWSVGCILVELFTGDALFQTHDNLEHLALMQKVLGRIPVRIIRRIGQSTYLKYFKHEELAFPDASTSRSSIKYVENTRSLKEIINPHESEYHAAFYDLLVKLLDYDPERRISARSALRHSFFSIGCS
ncbi:2703_t:CDS:2 [Paraglomus occultum]|uniref:2703_t:CDS:1 n=1 Tax=Paraglomus occultum TaxID=144539 RepID=A0A9N9A214_9GLOM|nr:2703_t:CDS:2 [Paraglomus occultum]